mmetsp:Transcript_35110/g.110518  ORF Transcript_35110/g.110518 Transcript_35110/m.110518 type:complete len:203 (-) Transcript_35110:28-636(-)
MASACSGLRRRLGGTWQSVTAASSSPSRNLSAATMDISPVSLSSASVSGSLARPSSLTTRSVSGLRHWMAPCLRSSSSSCCSVSVSRPSGSRAGFEFGFGLSLGWGLVLGLGASPPEAPPLRIVESRLACCSRKISCRAAVRLRAPWRSPPDGAADSSSSSPATAMVTARMASFGAAFASRRRLRLRLRQRQRLQRKKLAQA